MRYYLAVFVTLLIFFVLFFGMLAQYLGINYYTTIYIFRAAFVIFALITFIFYKRRSGGELFGKYDKYLFLINLAFLKISDKDDAKKLQILKSLFKSYSEKEIIKLFEKHKDTDINVDYFCSKLTKTETKLKIYLLYTLFNSASSDNILKKEEENFILKVTKLLRLPDKTYKSVKNVFIKKGLTDEEELKSKQRRQKFNKQFSYFLLPYEAYRIMGVSPSVTKAQLKKAYRTLAKKYHPDKYAGQSDAEIQKAEDKFQEIKEAYDVILKSKTF